MNETKHTPGPWEAEWTHKISGKTEGRYVFAPKDNCVEPSICEIPATSRLDGCEEANANLIAAAPDLLLALMAAMNDRLLVGRVYDMALTAIAKATDPAHA